MASEKPLYKFALFFLRCLFNCVLFVRLGVAARTVLIAHLFGYSWVEYEVDVVRSNLFSLNAGDINKTAEDIPESGSTLVQSR